MRRLLAALCLLVAPALGAKAESCSLTRFEGHDFVLCEVGPEDDLRLFLRGDKGTYGNFRAIDRALAPQGLHLGFAMNAGMYHRDYSPVGLYIEEHQELAPLITREGPGNFGLLPNGVFCWGEGRYRVMESLRFAREAPACRFATQSGPMLVIEDALHPRFLPQSDSTYIRNGVGTSADGRRAVFVISQRAVNFHLFARLFRDHLKLPNALYFDGNISRLYAPALRRHDGGFSMGPIVGTVLPKE